MLIIGVAILFVAGMGLAIALPEIPDWAYRDGPWGGKKPSWDAKARVVLAAASGFLLCAGMIVAWRAM